MREHQGDNQTQEHAANNPELELSQTDLWEASTQKTVDSPPPPSLQTNLARIDKLTSNSARRAAFNSIQRAFGNIYAAQLASKLAKTNKTVQPTTKGQVQRDPSPLTGQTAPGYDPTPDQARAALIAALAKTPLGQKAAEIFNKYNVGIIWEEKGTAGFEDRVNACHLNRKLGPNEAASYFIHEMYHASEFHSNNSRSPEKYPASEKEAYVKMMVNEEIEANFLQFESLYQMGGVGAKVSSIGPLQELTPNYIRIRRYWLDQHLKEHPEDKEGAEALSKGKCKQLIALWFERPSKRMTPKLAPNMFQTYAEYYAGLFDATHKNQSLTPNQGTTAPQTNAEEVKLSHDEAKQQMPQQ
jgi:hypothetical protein